MTNGVKAKNARVAEFARRLNEIKDKEGWEMTREDMAVKHQASIIARFTKGSGGNWRSVGEMDVYVPEEIPNR